MRLASLSLATPVVEEQLLRKTNEMWLKCTQSTDISLEDRTWKLESKERSDATTFGNQHTAFYWSCNFFKQTTV